MVVGKVASGKLSDDHRRQLLAKGQEITAEDIDENIPSALWGDIRIGDDKIEEELEGTCRAMRDQIHHLQEGTEEKISRLQGGDELSPGVIKLVKVFVAIKRKLQVGDKTRGVVDKWHNDD